ncbi:hypothetical protein BVG16_07175 [Paenibacillus selenitireducens]|uniref:Glycoside hydrolase 123 catalytic domain-containing protein n=1 Tax=Paenibacillus selenitireducens TaxID=1324314 RepID=A0A1T2XKV4_9BACL|nr:DUF4091 domain-containing protein [Paenibacillus selenitireducens]OPA80501.1 hypothetical protein BVG16_07175 [Paenibacillus selenitireducens]
MSYQPQFQTMLLSSLTKVFADEVPNTTSYSRASALFGETFSFQVAYTSDTLLKNIVLDIDSTLADRTWIRSVGLVPSEMPCFSNHDTDVLRTAPGLYPDPLYELDQQSINAIPGQWRSVWVTVTLDASVPAGDHTFQFTFRSSEGQVFGVSELFHLQVIPVSLPPQRLIHTEWFHVDCLATYYGVEVFSEEHWTLLERYVDTMVKHGMNMVLTPLFTPPLDTDIGGERPTVQLVDVVVEGDLYQFGFDKLTRWVSMCQRVGMKYFEFSHLFTQWGAKHAPKIIVTVDGVERQQFGWETDASSEAYRGFLDQLLPRLAQYLKEHGLEELSWFHISDEPGQEHLESYRAASEMIRKHLADYPIMDALSDIQMYEQGLVKRPIPANNHIEPFLAHQVPDLWTYYCCAQGQQVSNRFYNMPSARNRVIGLQLYKFGLQGFLHWGYNFWYSQYSINQQLDPYRTTDAMHAFPSGDAYLVYPGADGPIESIRLEVLYEGLQDLRALELLEQKIGKEQTIALMEETLSEPLTFTEYPRGSGDWLLAIRERINQALAD